MAKIKWGVLGTANITGWCTIPGMILGENTNARYDSLYIHGSKGSIRPDVEYNQQEEVSYKVYK